MESNGGHIGEEPKLSIEESNIRHGKNMLRSTKEHKKRMMKSNLSNNAFYGWITGLISISSFLVVYVITNDWNIAILICAIANLITFKALKEYVRYTINYSDITINEAFDEKHIILYGNYLQGKSEYE